MRNKGLTVHFPYLEYLLQIFLSPVVAIAVIIRIRPVADKKDQPLEWSLRVLLVPEALCQLSVFRKEAEVIQIVLLNLQGQVEDLHGGQQRAHGEDRRALLDRRLVVEGALCVHQQHHNLEITVCLLVNSQPPRHSDSRRRKACSRGRCRSCPGHSRPSSGTCPASSSRRTNPPVLPLPAIPNTSPRSSTRRIYPF